MKGGGFVAVINVETNPLQSIYADLEEILNTLVIKYSYNAELYETLETRKYSDQYLDALDSKDTFYTYQFTLAEYTAAIGVLNPGFTLDDATYNQIRDWQDNPRSVPTALQNQLLSTKRTEIIDSYEEPNNYYRMLVGLPPIETLTDDNANNPKFHYINDEFIAKHNLQDLNLQNYGIDPTVPVHLIEKTYGLRYINILESLGVLDCLREDFPDENYLNFLGSKKVEIDVARRAKNFSILKMNYNVRKIISQAFYDLYEMSRLYFVNVIYIPQQRNVIDYYDNFIALCIMTMTIQQLFARTVSYAIDREFFDEYMVKLLYSVYGLPYESRLTYDIQRRIVKNLNLLIQRKATNQVIYDIAYILGFHNITISKYYIVKERKFDSKGNLIYAMKDTLDDYGNVIGEEYDLSKMYDVHFQKVDLDSQNIMQDIMDESKYQDYESITMDDPLWWEDDSLWSEIYERDWNYAETKYLGLTISYKLSELLFENIVLMRMVFDLKDSIEEIQIDLPRLLDTGSVSLFEAVVFLCACICKKYGIKGEILTDPSKVIAVLDTLKEDPRCDTLGFNFRAVSAEIVNPVTCPYVSCPYHIRNNPDSEYQNGNCTMENTPCASQSHLQMNIEGILKYLTDEEKTQLDSYLDDLIISGKTMEEQVKCFNNLYADIKGLFYFISNHLCAATDPDEYDAYLTLYHALFIIQEENEMFRKGVTEDSPVAETFLDYLSVMNPDLANIVEEQDEVELYNTIDHVISQMELVIGNLDAMYLVNDGTSILQEYLIKLVRFFKSYTTELTGLGVLYIFDFKPDNMLRLIDCVGKIEKEIQVSEKESFGLYDYMTKLKSSITISSKNMKLRDSCHVSYSDPT